MLHNPVSITTDRHYHQNSVRKNSASKKNLSKDLPPSYESVVNQKPPSYQYAIQPKNQANLPEQSTSVTIQHVNSDNSSGAGNHNRLNKCKPANLFYCCCCFVAVFAMGFVGLMIAAVTNILDFS